MPKIRWTLDQKKHHVTAWQTSGLTRQQYCELVQIVATMATGHLKS